MVNSEKKTVDTQASNTVSATGAIGTLNAVSQGSAFNERTGDRMRMHSCTFKYDITVGSNNPLTLVRVILFYWKDPTNAPSVSEILQQSNTAGYKDLESYNKSKILVDKWFSLDQYHPIKTMSAKVDFNNKLARYAHTRFAAGTSTLTQGGLYILELSNQTGAGNEPSARYSTRVFYYDN